MTHLKFKPIITCVPLIKVTLKRKPRNINISSLKVLSIENDEISLRISCSKGTYIRTLVESIGYSLGTGAYTKELRRIRIGSLYENSMITLDEISTDQNCIISLEELTKNMISMLISDSEWKLLKQGQIVHTSIYKNINEIAIKNQNSDLIGLGTIIDNYIHVKRLINFDE